MSLIRYVLTQAAYIDNRLRQAGEIVWTDIAPGPHMKPAPIDEAASTEAPPAAPQAAAPAAPPAEGAAVRWYWPFGGDPSPETPAA